MAFGIKFIPKTYWDLLKQIVFKNLSLVGITFVYGIFNVGYARTTDELYNH